MSVPCSAVAWNEYRGDCSSVPTQRHFNSGALLACARVLDAHGSGKTWHRACKCHRVHHQRSHGMWNRFLFFNILAPAPPELHVLFTMLSIGCLIALNPVLHCFPSRGKSQTAKEHCCVPAPGEINLISGRSLKVLLM